MKKWDLSRIFFNFSPTVPMFSTVVEITLLLFQADQFNLAKHSQKSDLHLKYNVNSNSKELVSLHNANDSNAIEQYTLPIFGTGWIISESYCRFIWSYCLKKKKLSQNVSAGNKTLLLSLKKRSYSNTFHLQKKLVKSCLLTPNSLTFWHRLQ